MNISCPRPYRAAEHAPSTPARPRPRYRDIGVGYGDSSGYVRRRGYARSSMSPRFQMA